MAKATQTLESAQVQQEESTNGRRPKYRELYEERGNPDHCGDWLAKELEGRFRYEKDGEDRFDHEAFTEVLKENGVSLTGKWADLPNSGQHGWPGRYRMTGRLQLEIEVTNNGVLKIEGESIKPPMDWINEMLEKHNKLRGT